MEKKEFLFENAVGKHFIDEKNKVSVILNEGVEEFLTLPEACKYCIEIMKELQIKKFGKLL